MRFRKGTSVEVLSYSEEPLGSWMCGELISGNGRYYTVKCQSNDWKGSERVLGRVSRHSLRPTPPVLNVKKWARGDIVEVRCDISWKLSSVMGGIDKDTYLVKFMGYSQEFKVHKLDIRPRLVWQDEKWVLFGKGHQIVRSNLRRGDVGDKTFNAQCKMDSLPSFIIRSSTLKRFSPYRSPLAVNSLKKLKIIIDGKHKQAVQLQTQQPDSVHAPAWSPQNCDHIRTEQSSNVGTSDYHDCPKETPNPFQGSLIRSHEFNDSHTTASSVGSCSFSHGRGSTPCCLGTAALSSDADSCSVSEYDKMLNLSTEEVELYRLELHEYRKLLKVFHSSGFISWENEGLLTDLRMSLHISDDDHLMELQRVRPLSMVLHVK